MGINLEEYKYVIQVNYTNHHPMYYNSGNYMVVSNPFDATRYKTTEGEELAKHFRHAESQGGESKWIEFTEALKSWREIKKKLEEEYE